MEIRKGPYGHFIFERISSDTSIFKYAIEMINKDIPGIFLSVYVYDFNGYKELSYDFSDLIRLNEITEYDINILRNAIGNLFLSFHKCLDYLLPLSNVVLDEDFMFINKDYSRIYFCYCPVYGNQTLRLDSFEYRKIEKLLSLPVFKETLATDEINQLLFSIKNNDEQLFLNAAKAIKNPIDKSNKTKKGNRKYTITLIILTLTFSVLSFFFFGLIPSVILITISLLIILQFISQNTKTRAETTDNSTLHEARKQILFKEEPLHKDINNNCLFIESLDKVNGEFIKNAIYTTNAIIGSDCFLSDICINDSNIAPLNAEITLKNNVYTLRKLTEKNNVAIEGVIIQSDKDYELKSGQTITIGGIKLLIKIGFV